MNVPPKLLDVLGHKKPDFIVKSARRFPLEIATRELFGGAIALGLLYGIFTLTFYSVLPWYVFVGIATYAGIGIVLSLSGLYKLFAPGSWFAGTKENFHEYRYGVLVSMPWSLFSGAVTATGKEERGSVEIEFKHSVKLHQLRAVYISDIPNPFEVQVACAKRIKSFLSAKNK